MVGPLPSPGTEAPLSLVGKGLGSDAGSESMLQIICQRAQTPRVPVQALGDDSPQDSIDTGKLLQSYRNVCSAGGGQKMQ